MMPRFSLAIVAALCALANVAVAQSTSMFGSSSVSNRSSGMGMGSMGGMGMGGFGGMGGMGMSGMGMSGFGGMGGLGGMGGFGGMSGQGMGMNRGTTGFGTPGNTFGGSPQGAFVGRNVNPNQFVGMNAMTGGAQGRQNTTNRQGTGGAGRNLGLNLSNLNLMQNLNQGGSASQATQPPMLRARQKVAFEVPRRQPTAVESSLQAHFGKLTSRNAALKGVTLSLDEKGVVVLQGDVASESAARLAEKIVRLEPGVRQVRSELSYPKSE
jgi:hypothetical protein